MGTMCCPHPAPLSEEQGWYIRTPPPAEKQSLRRYELDKRTARYQRVKQSYAEHSVLARRRRIYEDAVAALAARKQAAALQPRALVNEWSNDFECRLRQQADKWQAETAHLSSPLQRMMHPSYQAILGMSAEGEASKRATIRFMLMDLRKSQRDWFLALSYLTQQNPISAKDYGKTNKMAASWLEWGARQGLLQK